jgi:hypothetical protein
MPKKENKAPKYRRAIKELESFAIGEEVQYIGPSQYFYGNWGIIIRLFFETGIMSVRWNDDSGIMLDYSIHFRKRRPIKKKRYLE